MQSKRPVFGIASLAALLGAGCVLKQPDEPAGQGEQFVSVQQHEPDLQLHAKLERADPVHAGDGPWVSVTLVNTSKTATHRVIKPGHGSEVGYREPHIFWTATINRGNGEWVPITDEVRYGYCGTCLATASFWPKDVVPFGPGATLDVAAPQQFEFQHAGRVRLQAHYEFRGTWAWHERFTPEALAPAAGLAPFKLSSNVVEFEVIRPLDVRVRVKGPLKANRTARLSDVLDVRLVNVSDKPVECSSPTLHADARLGLGIRAELGWGPSLAEQATTYGVKKTLAPGEEVPLLGPGEFPNGLDGTWEYPRAERVKVRAVYTPATWKHAPSVASEWVEVQVEE